MKKDLVVGCARGKSISQNVQKHPESTRPVCTKFTKVKNLKKFFKKTIDKCIPLW